MIYLTKVSLTRLTAHIRINNYRRCDIRKSIVVLSVLMLTLSFLFVTISSAQDQTGDSIFAYKKELSMTDKQETNLRNILTKLQDYISTKTKKLNELRVELRTLITDKANLRTIKAKLRAIATMQADATYEDIVSVRAIEKELTAEQMAKWRAIQEDFMKRQQEAQAAAAKAKEIAEQPKVEAKAAVAAPVVVE